MKGRVKGKRKVEDKGTEGLELWKNKELRNVERKTGVKYRGKRKERADLRKDKRTELGGKKG